MLTLIAPVGAAPEAVQLPREYSLRPCRPSDIPDLARLYFEAFEPGIACSTLEEAVADIRASFAGEYGELWQEASAVALTTSREIVAGCLVVRRAPWEGTPDCPYINDLFVSRGHRRRGVARALVVEAMRVVARAGHESIALRVDEDNAAALSLYRQLGFEEWKPDAG